jgi:diadenosine tetraphosphatase ApaH/serine/threonine PP2A family protein phosphatase
MRVLVISDIHANLTALETVLEDAGEVDVVWALGDVVGYGPDPNECIERVKSLPNIVCLLGNHDAATLGLIDVLTFNPAARLAIQWTREHVKPENLEFLRKLPESFREDNITLVHGSPREPVWEYLLDPRNAGENFRYFHTTYCFVGHTHLPIMYHMGNGNQFAQMISPATFTPLQLSPRSIINPGSVGQPRDHDPRASYLLFDKENQTIEYRRVEYDVEAVQNRMQEAGLPNRHIQRLADGW